MKFIKGEIESIPLEDASVDAVISNCVINLSVDNAPRLTNDATEDMNAQLEAAGGKIMIDNELKLFSRSHHNIWTDPHLSRTMLAAHLDETHDAASRKGKTIDATISYLQEYLPNRGRILDLGCGPGLYALKLAQRGYTVHGIDINPHSIDYARAQVGNHHQRLTYQCADYLLADFDGPYDAILMIYCDMGALTESEQGHLLSKCNASLKAGGLLMFDVHTEDVVKSKRFGRRWYSSPGGDFWSSEPYIMLEECKRYPSQRVIGNRNVVVTAAATKEFITWDQYYTPDSIRKVLASQGFGVLEITDQLIRATSFAAPSVLFVTARKQVTSTAKARLSEVDQE